MAALGAALPLGGYRGALDKSAEMRTHYVLKTLKRRTGLTNSR